MNVDGTNPFPRGESERKATHVNAAFGRADLIGENHFRFSRRSGLPVGYFDRNRHAEKWLRWVCYASGAIVIAAWILLPL